MEDLSIVDAVPPDELRKIAADSGLLDDADAVAEMAVDQLVRHGVLIRERGGMRFDPWFVCLWEDACAGDGTLYASLSRAVRGWTGGALDGTAVDAMCLAAVDLLRDTEVGSVLDAETAELLAGLGPVTHGRVRGSVSRARARLGRERL